MSEPFPLPFLLNGIAQIAILVEDLEKAMNEYWSKFGIGNWQIYTYQQPLVKKMSYYGKPAHYSMRLALANIGSMRIELIQPLEGDSVYADFIKEHGYGVHHLGVLVEDMQKAIELAEKAGYRMIMDGSGFGLDGDGHYAYLDTEKDLGVTIELIQRPKGRNTPEMIFPSSNIPK